MNNNKNIQNILANYKNNKLIFEQTKQQQKQNFKEFFFYCLLDVIKLVENEKIKSLKFSFGDRFKDPTYAVILNNINNEFFVINKNFDKNIKYNHFFNTKEDEKKLERILINFSNISIFQIEEMEPFMSFSAYITKTKKSFTFNEELLKEFETFEASTYLQKNLPINPQSLKMKI